MEKDNPTRTSLFAITWKWARGFRRSLNSEQSAEKRGESSMGGRGKCGEGKTLQFRKTRSLYGMKWAF